MQTALEQAQPDNTLGKDFKDHCANLFLTNRFSAKEALILVEKAFKAGIEEVEGMGKAKGAGIPWRNTARNLLRTLLQNVDVPYLYWAQVPMANPKANNTKPELQWLPFRLPFGLLVKLVSKDPNITKVASQFPEPGPTVADVHRFCDKMNIDHKNVVLMGIHGDGVPHRKKSTVEVVS